MMNNKKKLNKIKTENFLNEFPIIFLLQQNNFTVKDWLNFKEKMQEIKNNFDASQQLEILKIKNSLLKKILLTSHQIDNSNLSENTFNFLCQGPNFIIGCKNDNHLNFLWNFINSNSKLIFISCIYKNQILNHLDLEILLKTDNSIYSGLIQNLDKKTDLYSLLQQSLTLYPLIQVQYNLLNILSQLKCFKNDK